ncbi:bactofilin family protein [Calidithermus roseus]|uniref:Polymer-forming cytoskeletal n=1 Tax=Calidithermus roseus TaxID=1644118 RepID=A0A399EDJ7_9DEIN|nr:polymer-forming cytoskeletal protein [Calidithermus roseus]RIH82405.1 Polymer-forming cytoskeletal [Calidithermus roseus]
MLSRGKSSPNASLTYLAEGSELEGTLKAKGQVRIDGVVRGSVLVEGELEIGPSGVVEGEQLRAKNAHVQGKVRAAVSVEGKLTLTKSGQLEGDVRARALDIEAGAVFIGRSQTGEVKAALPQPSKPASE